MFRLLRKQFCNHKWREHFSGAFEDEPGGPRTMHYIHWTCDKCGASRGDDLNRAQRPPELPAWFKRKGWTYRGFAVEGELEPRWVIVCDTCGGNCGQCGTSVAMGIPASLQTIVETTGMNTGKHAGLPRG